MPLRKWMNSLEDWKQPHRYVVLVIIVLIAYVIYRHQSVVAREKEMQLQREFSFVKPPQGALLLESKIHSKAGSAYIERRYSSPYSFDDLISYYSSQLPQYGWIYHDKMKLPSGLERLEFCKNEFAADIDIDSTLAARREFWFSMTWGLNRCP
jgi:hypothetical protein